jgi:hypothetical protein
MNVKKVAETLWQQKQRTDFETADRDLKSYNDAKEKILSSQTQLKDAEQKLFEISRTIAQHGGVSRHVREEAVQIRKDLEKRVTAKNEQNISK